MNKRVQISLILVVTPILLMSLSLPGSAKQNGHKETCYIWVLTVDKFGNYELDTKLYGELYAGWAGPDYTLFNQCTGVIPFDDPVNPVKTFASYQDWCDHIQGATCVNGYFYWSPVDWDPLVYDPFSGNYYPAMDSRLSINPDGGFIFNTSYVP